MRIRTTVSALHFREAIRSAVDACDCTIESIARKCGVTRQAVSYMLMGRCKMRKGTAQAIANVMTAELRAEIVAEQERIGMLEQLIADIENTYKREYAEEENRNE